MALKIGIVCPEYFREQLGGIGVFYRELASALCDAGHSVVILGVGEFRGSEGRDRVSNGVRIERVRAGRMGRLGPLLTRARLWRAVRELAKLGEVQIVEAPEYGGVTAFWPRVSVPLVLRLHGSHSVISRDQGLMIDPMVGRLERVAYRRADHCAAVSRYIAERSRSVFGRSTSNNQTHVLYSFVGGGGRGEMGVRGNHTVVFAGTLNENKGVERLLLAWRKVKKAVKQAELLVFGKDGRTSRGESVKNRLLRDLDGWKDSGVVLRGHADRNTILAVLQRARVAVVPSITEALSLAAIEAMSCGCPIVASNRAALPEIVVDRKSGLLVDPVDVDGIGDAIIEVLRDDELALTLGRAGMERVQERFSKDVCLVENERFYRSCVGQKLGGSELHRQG